MRAWSRLRAHGGLWTLVAVLAAAVVFVVTAVGPTIRYSEDRALRAAVANAPTATRDITVFEPTHAYGATARDLHDHVAQLLEPPLAEVVNASWGAQRSRLERPSALRPQQFVSLAGPGVSSDPAGFLPLSTVAHLTDLDSAVRMVDGQLPTTEPGAATIEVMTSVAVAEALGLRVGEVYHLLLGVGAVVPMPAGELPEQAVAVALTGVYEPVDATAPIWQLGPLLAPGLRQWPVADQTAPIRQATLVTDQTGITNLVGHGLDEFFGFQGVALFRLDHTRLDVAWLAAAREAVNRLPTNPELRETMRVQSGLAGLFDEFERQAAAARAVVAVVVAGVIATFAGLLVLAARLTVERRRAEILLVRSRGGSLATVAGRFLGEALLVVLPAVVAGWALHLLLPRGPAEALLPGLGVGPLLAAAVAVLLVPLAVVADQHHYRRGLAAQRRREVTGHRASPVRLTVEAAVITLAAVGVLLVHQRGLRTEVGTDPYLSALPVLIGLAAGLLGLRLYPWPLRLLGMVAARRRSLVAFLGLTRAGRAGPVTALPLLILVLVVAAGGFAAAVNSSVAAARDAAALQAVGADIRIVADDLPADADAAVDELPGVVATAALSRSGFLRVGRGVDQSTVVISVDAPAYQQILESVDAPVRLPPELTDARPGGAAIPVLTSVSSSRTLSLEIGGREYPVTVVGDLAGLPRLAAGRSWVLVPRQALAEPPGIDQLLVAGPEADPELVAAAVGRQPLDGGMITLADRRAEVEQSGFNRGLTVVFIVGIVGAALGGLLAVGLSLVVPAAARGHTLSLLRTMGLSAGQSRRLLLMELLPITTIAVVVGATVGLATPVVLAPALGLTEFTAAAPIPTAVSPGVVAILAGLLVIFVVGGVVAEAAVNRRLGLGQVLRVE